MVWFIVLIVIFQGQHVEFVGTTEYQSLEACNTQAAKLAQIPIRVPAAVTCISEARA